MRKRAEKVGGAEWMSRLERLVQRQDTMEAEARGALNERGRM